MKRSHWAALALGALGIGTLIMLEEPLDPRRKKIVDAALSRVGETDPTEFWADTMPGAPPSDYPKDWCGGFALWAIHQGDIGKDLDWKIELGFLIPNLTQTKNPKPGDIAYFARNQHEAVVSAVDGPNVSLVNGNGENGQVTTSNVPKSIVTAFFSLEPLLKKAPLPTTVSGGDPCSEL